MSVGRLPIAKIESGENFYLRMLLHVVHGACSFEDLRSVNGVLHGTFKEACASLGLLDDDSEWDHALLECIHWASAWQLRHLFVSIMLCAEVVDLNFLWEKYWKDLSDDFQTRVPPDSMEDMCKLSHEELKQKALLHLECILNRNGKSLSNFKSMPTPTHENIVGNRLIVEEVSYDREHNGMEFQKLYSKLNDDQKNCYEEILSSIDKLGHSLFFVYGSGGTGKTFLWNTLIAKLRGEGKIILAVASSGIALLLLPGGRTAHSRFKIPFELNSFSTCSISQQCDLAALIQQSKMVIWDEAPMMHKDAFDAVDRTFRDILKTINEDACKYVFGGMTVVFGGDFRQILPVIPKASRSEVVANSIQRSNAWKYCHILILKKNMRIFGPAYNPLQAKVEENFAKWILGIGDGCVHVDYHNNEDNEDWIRIPDDLLIEQSSTSIDMLINFTYPDLLLNYKNLTYMCARAILAPRNDEIDELNINLCRRIQTPERLYYSCDSALRVDESKAVEPELCTSEYLHSLNFNGVPPHILEVRVGCPIMLLRNINQSLGLCNGTRLIVKELHEKTMEAEIMTGNCVGQRIYIPRIVFYVNNNKANFILKRRQFPIKLAFAMTINKSQGLCGVILDELGIFSWATICCIVKS